MRLALRGLWWRRGSSFVVLLVIVLAIAGAVAGPLFARAAAESALRIRLEQAPDGQRGIRITSQGPPSESTLREVGASFPAALLPYFRMRIPALQLHSPVLTDVGLDGVTDLTWRPGFCEHLVLVSGHCPRGPAEAIVSARTAVPGSGVSIGANMQVDTAKPLRVVGIYRPANLSDPYWFGKNYFNAHLYQGPGEGPDTLDAVFVDEPVITSAPTGPMPRVWIDFYLAPDRIRLDDLTRIDAATRALLRRHPPLASPATQTVLPQLLDAAAHDRSVLNEGCLIVVAQLVLLGWLVLHHIITGTSEARATEIAAAKLRGWRTRAVIRFGLGETALLMAAGVPLGMVGGYVATRVLTAATLTAGTPVLIRAAPAVAAAIAATGAAVAAALASRQVLRRPILDQWRRAESQVSASGRIGLALDIAIGFLACAGLVVLRLTGAIAGGRPHLAALLAPGLFIVAVAKLGARLVPAAGRLAVRRSRASRRVATFLAVRQVARRRDGLGASALLAMAIGLAVFSIAAISVMQTNEQARARAELGAAQVVVVQPQPGVDFGHAVERADPDGRWAMGVAKWQPVGGNVVGQLYAVQTARLARVAYWQHAWGATDLRELQRDLRPSVAPSVSISGSQIRLNLTAAGRLGARLPNVAVTLADRRGRSVLALGPTIRRGSHTYTLSTGCAAPCRLVDIEVYRALDDIGQMTGTVIVHDLAQRTRTGWQPVATNLAVSRDWRAGPTYAAGYVHTHSDASGLRMDFSVEAGGWPKVEVADYPRPLPVVVASHAQSTPGPLYVGELVDVMPLNRVAQLRILPRALDDGVLADLELATAQLPAFDTATDEVWMSSSAPHDALDRLRAAGLTTGDPETLAARLLALRSQGPAETLNLLRFASLIAALLALAATALSLSLTARRRAFELAALRTVGVRRSILQWSSVIEQFLLLAIGVGLGTAAALVAVAFGASSVPQFSDLTPVPLTFAANPVTVGLFVAGLVVFVVLGATIAGRLLLRAAVPTLLREAAP